MVHIEFSVSMRRFNNRSASFTHGWWQWLCSACCLARALRWRAHLQDWALTSSWWHHSAVVWRRRDETLSSGYHRQTSLREQRAPPEIGCLSFSPYNKYMIVHHHLVYGARLTNELNVSGETLEWHQGNGLHENSTFFKIMVKQLLGVAPRLYFGEIMRRTHARQIIARVEGHALKSWAICVIK